MSEPEVMDAKAWISVGSAVISVVAMIVSVVTSAKSRAVSIGSLETSLRTAISQTRVSVRNIAVQIGAMMDGKTAGQLNAADSRRLEPLSQAFAEAVEDNLNAYEDACAKYLDGKIDRKRFKKMYAEEIRNLCRLTEAPTAKLIYPEATSKYRAIWRVFREWHIPE